MQGQLHLCISNGNSIVDSVAVYVVAADDGGVVDVEQEQSECTYSQTDLQTDRRTDLQTL